MDGDPLDETGVRRPYVRSFVRNLDVVETESKTHNVNEFPIQFGSPGQTVTVGPS
jgi:hypothetical protein